MARLFNVRNAFTGLVVLVILAFPHGADAQRQPTDPLPELFVVAGAAYDGAGRYNAPGRLFAIDVHASVLIDAPVIDDRILGPVVTADARWIVWISRNPQNQQQSIEVYDNRLRTSSTLTIPGLAATGIVADYFEVKIYISSTDALFVLSARGVSRILLTFTPADLSMMGDGRELLLLRNDVALPTSSVAVVSTTTHEILRTLLLDRRADGIRGGPVYNNFTPPRRSFYATSRSTLLNRVQIGSYNPDTGALEREWTAPNALNFRIVSSAVDFGGDTNRLWVEESALQLAYHALC